MQPVLVASLGKTKVWLKLVNQGLRRPDLPWTCSNWPYTQCAWACLELGMCSGRLSWNSEQNVALYLNLAAPVNAEGEKDLG